jgi:hypothetical protein
MSTEAFFEVELDRRHSKADRRPSGMKNKRRNKMTSKTTIMAAALGGLLFSV